MTAAAFSQMQGQGGSSPVALAIFDFANGEYYANGAPRSLGDMFRTLNNGWWDPSYAIDPADIEAGVGWHAQSDNTNIALLSLLAMTGWWEPGVVTAYSAVMEFTRSSPAPSDFASLNLVSSPSTGNFPYARSYMSDFNNAGVPVRGAQTRVHNGVTSYINNVAAPSASPTLKTGTTINGAGSHYAVVENGGPVATLAATGGAFEPDYSTMDDTRIENYATGTATQVLKKVTIYAPLSDAVLQSLTV